MAANIVHSVVKVPGERVFAVADWNPPHTVTGLPRGRTLIVAASDSMDTTDADYFCDGVADEVQINQAITALPATGGSVCLMDGTFNIAAAVAMNKASVLLIGQGNSTRLVISAAIRCVDISATDCKVQNIQFTGSRVLNYYGVYSNQKRTCVINCKFADLWYAAYFGDDDCVCEANVWDRVNYGVYLGSSADNSIVSGNTGDDVSEGIYCAARLCVISGNNINSDGLMNIYSSGQENVITGNYLYGGSTGVYVTNTWNTVTGNHFSHCGRGVRITGKNCSVCGNTFRDSSTNDIMVNAHHTAVVGNTIEDGGTTTASIYVAYVNYCTVVGNTLVKLDREGIELNGSHHCVVSGNNIHDCSEDANNTYSGILLTGTSTYNVVANNRVTGNAANRHRYGIRENAAADDWNLLHGNVLTDAVTANLSSQGLNSVTADNIAP